MDQTDEFKSSANTSDIESIMESQALPNKLKLNLRIAVNNVMEGLMEGGSRLRLIIKIIKNCLESNATSDRKILLIDSVSLCEVVPIYIHNVSSNQDNSETWFTSCLIDLLDLALIIVDIVKLKPKTVHLSQLRKIFESISSCLVYPSDKQHKVKTTYLKLISEMLVLLADENITPLEFHVVEKFVKLAKLMQKMQPLLTLVYDVVYNFIRYNADFSKPLCTLVKDGSQQWLLNILLKDFAQKKNIFQVIRLLVVLCDSNKILEQVASHCENISALMVMAQNDKDLKLWLFKLCIQLISEKKEVER